MPRILKDLKISEVSGVDRGAGEGVRVVLMKRHDQQQEIEMTEADIAKLIADGVAKALPTVLPGLIEKSVADIKKASDAALAKANGEIAVLKMSGDEKAFCEKKGMDADAMKAFAAKTPEERKAAMSKAADAEKDPPAITSLQGELVKRDTTIADMQKRLAAHDEREAIATFAKRATDAGLKAEDGEIMRKAYGGDADAQTKLDAKFTELTKSLKAARETGQIFNEFGAAGGERTGSAAYDQLVAKAADLRKTEAGTKLSAEQAFAKVYEDPANRELAIQHRREEMVRKSAVIAA